MKHYCPVHGDEMVRVEITRLSYDTETGRRVRRFQVRCPRHFSIFWKCGYYLSYYEGVRDTVWEMENVPGTIIKWS